MREIEVVAAAGAGPGAPAAKVSTPARGKGATDPSVVTLEEAATTAGISRSALNGWVR